MDDSLELMKRRARELFPAWPESMIERWALAKLAVPERPAVQVSRLAPYKPFDYRFPRRLQDALPCHFDQ